LAEWSPTLEVGLPDIDAQHKGLFDLAASFADDMDEVKVMTSVHALCDYVRLHFREEERMLEACGFPGLAAHRQLHAEFRAMLLELLDEAKTMSLDQVAAQVRILVNGWFYQHILTVDSAYVPHVRARLASRQGGAAL
jgi:hemerythrin